MTKFIKNKRQCNYKVTSTTLDLRHKSQMEEFQDLQNQLHGYKDDIAELNVKLDALRLKPKTDLNDAELLDITDLIDSIDETQCKIDKISGNEDEIDYFTKTGNVLFEYYSLLGNSNNINAGTRKSKIIDSSSATKRCVVDFFTKKSAQSNVESTATVAISNANAKPNANAKGNPNISINENNRAELLDEYLSYTDEHYINNKVTNRDSSICAFCGNDELQFYVNESIYCCEVCWTVEKVITDNEKPSYKDPPKEISYFSYKRINHYTEWLNQIQGKETTDIPEHVFEAILSEFKKQRVVDLSTVTRQKVKEILKKLKINKYYEHIPYILNRITGNPNPHLSSELENKLKEMFALIQVPFLRHAPLIRKNFLSYSYVLHKFIQLLGQTEYLQFFPLLKSREKLMQQEVIWRKICEDLHWQFIRSI